MLSELPMIPLVAITGFLDGIHPCAIAILIFFIAFLLTMRKTFKNIFLLGLVYIFVIFLTYLAVGVGLLSGIVLFGQHHFFAILGSWLLIFLGLIHIKEYFFPNLPLHFRMPKFSSEKVKSRLEKATLPGIALAAFLVGLCSVPCSGGIYAAITALLASKTTYFSGFLYLLLYNLMFVMPLLILLLFAANPLTLAKIAAFQQKHEKTGKLVMGLLMIIIGASILIFFV
ncbi:MAG: GAP family protein [Candidatus Nealsonbacteria bacterium]|nr:GAP family protein [Candidatus Nealsonbacteria bacterium]